MILESNLLAKLQVEETMLSHGLNTLHFDGTTDAQKHFLGFQISTPGQNLSLSISETIRGDTLLGTLTPSIPTKCLSTVCIV
jgi:hypothetical protein